MNVRRCREIQTLLCRSASVRDTESSRARDYSTRMKMFFEEGKDVLPASDFLLDLADWLRSFHRRLSITVKRANHAELSLSRFQHLPDLDSAFYNVNISDLCFYRIPAS
ncbi:hypothetical protein QQF64_016858 [Cirrhinus molitorella]|uniref:Uncharacterized protein n=1 Tax=Cirrhinus molitorella TaxID=172907 RepID=A0ABR3LNY6_9TELE